MITELEQLSKETLQAMPRRNLEDLAWQEKEIIALLKDELNSATESNQDLKDKAQNLEETLEKLRKILFGKSSEKSEKPPSNKRGGSSSGNPLQGKKSKLPSERYPNIEVIDIERELDFAPQCACCGETMKDSGLREITEQLTVVPRKFQIHRIANPKFHCTCCYSGLETCQMPRIKPGSSFSDAMIIEVSASKYADLVPIERYCELAANDGLVGLAPHTLIDLTHYLAEYLEPVVEKIKTSLLSSSLMHADETPHRMLEGDEKSNWYLWGFCDGRNSYFEIHDTRSGDVASAILAQSNCYALMSDVFSGYARAVREANKLRSKERQIINVYCNAHARRKFVEAEVSYPKEAQLYIEAYQQVYQIEAKMKALSEEAQFEERKSMEPHFRRMQIQGGEDLKTVSSKSSLAKAIGYFTENFPELTVCLKDPKIPLDNNLEERQLRRPVIGRKTWYGTHSKRGAATAAALFTVTQSCRICGVNVREYLHEVIKTLHKGGPPFTPWEFSLRKAAEAEPASFLKHE